MGRKTSTSVTPAHWLGVTEAGSWEGGGTFGMDLKLIVHAGCPGINSPCLGLSGCRYKPVLGRFGLAWLRGVEFTYSPQQFCNMGLVSQFDHRVLGTQKVSFP